ncbi:hypothetical protein HanHA300_Chr03g0101221 [Helianthus annuus]|nr:hypothetical protein HanHA300_Chr03g0101221 [Helianthus annuus]KAJ0608794.1 hypothetical protein HanHA89_Chr03g0112931 [Helianthus annuus]
MKLTSHWMVRSSTLPVPSIQAAMKWENLQFQLLILKTERYGVSFLTSQNHIPAYIK